MPLLITGAGILAGIALLRRTRSEEEDTETGGVAPERAIELDKAITILRSAEELYLFWRHLENLPYIMRHLESVRARGSRLSTWAAKAPAGFTVSWDAEIIEEDEPRLIRWRSVPGSAVANEGLVRFDAAPGGRGTVVRVWLRYDPPGGRVGHAIARMFGRDPGVQIAEDLNRFRQLMETGDIISTAGQPSGR